MDINARIKWTPGMELNAQTFSALDDNFDLRQLISVRTANGLRIGRLPYAEFHAEGMFVRNTFEIERLQCMALLADGMLISADERVSVPITRMSDGTYYLCVGFGDQLTEFEKHDQTYLRPEYSYSFKPLEELESKLNLIDSAFPFLRFKVEEGRITIDKEYIAPCLIIGSDPRLKTHIEKVIARIKVLTEHQNMEEGDCKRTLLKQMFTLGTLSERDTTELLMQTFFNVAQTVDYYIVTPNEEVRPEVEEWSQYDVVYWLTWFDTYLENAARTLDHVVLVDNSIDYEKLKAELRAEIYAMVKDDINTQIAEAREHIRVELTENLTTLVRETIETQKKQLHDSLHAQLLSELQQPLYDSLYKALYDALYRPPVEEEDNFMPLI